MARTGRQQVECSKEWMQPREKSDGQWWQADGPEWRGGQTSKNGADADQGGQQRAEGQIGMMEAVHGESYTP